MGSKTREEWAELLIGGGLSAVVIPSVLLFLGSHPATVAAVGFFLTVGVAAWGFPERRTAALWGLIVSGLIALFVTKYEEGYLLQFQVCTSEGYGIRGSAYTLDVINVGIRFINHTGHDIWVVPETETFSL